MEPWEVMISESQERMVAVVRPQLLDDGRGGLRALGARTRARSARSPTPASCARSSRASVVGDDPAPRYLTDEAPALRRVEPQPRARPSPPPAPQGPPTTRRAARAARLAEPPQPRVGLPPLRPSRRLAHRSPARAGRRRAPAPPLVPRARRRLDGTGRIARARPAHRRRAGRARGGAQRRLHRRRAARRSRTASTSATPRSREIAWELAEAIEGMAPACEALGIPVVSGNVSLYNETDGRAIHPTPVVGCVGLVDDVRTRAGRLARGRRDPTSPASRALVRRLRVPGALRRARRPPGPARPRGGGRADRVLCTRSRRAARSSTTSPRAASRSRSRRPRSRRASAPSSTCPTTR